MKYPSVKPLTSRIFQDVPEIPELSPDGMEVLGVFESCLYDAGAFVHGCMAH